MKLISHKALFAILHYDPAAGIWTWKVDRGNASKSGSRAGSINRDGYRVITINGREYRSARLAYFYMKGRWPRGYEIENINRIRHDDAWDNLRKATSGQNNSNQDRCRVRAGQVRTKANGLPMGVIKDGGRFRAQARQDGKRISLGTHDTPERAAKAYRRADANGVANKSVGSGGVRVPLPSIARFGWLA